MVPASNDVLNQNRRKERFTAFSSPAVTSCNSGFPTCSSLKQIKTLHRVVSIGQQRLAPGYQTALVTGASHGIGPFIVRALAKEGMNLVLAARSESELEQVVTAADIRATGVQVLSVPTDVTDRDARSALVNTAERTFGAVDVLVNNAGGDLQREFHHYTADDVEALIRLNLTGPIELTRLLLPGMLRRKQGHIVNISSLGGRIGFPYTEVYSACKDG